MRKVSLIGLISVLAFVPFVVSADDGGTCNGSPFDVEASVKDATTVNGAFLTLVPSNEISVYTVTLNSNKYASATAPTPEKTAKTQASPTTIYELYGNSWQTVPYYTSTQSAKLTKITTLPTMDGHVFAGFRKGKAGTGDQVIPATGTLPSNTTISSDITLYADWKECTVPVASVLSGRNLGSVTASVKNNKCFYTWTCKSGLVDEDGNPSGEYTADAGEYTFPVNNYSCKPITFTVNYKCNASDNTYAYSQECDLNNLNTCYAEGAEICENKIPGYTFTQWACSVSTECSTDAQCITVKDNRDAYCNTTLGTCKVPDTTVSCSSSCEDEGEGCDECKCLYQNNAYSCRTLCDTGEYPNACDTYVSLTGHSVDDQPEEQGGCDYCEDELDDTPEGDNRYYSCMCDCQNEYCDEVTD